MLRVEERQADGHKFLGIDPHWFKPDSLSNAVAAYAQSFLIPIAQTAEETNDVLRAFVAEFQARKGGQSPKPWQKITIVIDEVNSLMDTTTDLEKENADLLKSVARVCGQEARNFLMGGIFASQQATGLAWLRKVALMVLVHQLLMESEKSLACNGDKAVMADMKTWPIGRTYVYGVGFSEGPRTVQQPFFAPRIVDASPVMPELPRNTVFQKSSQVFPSPPLRETGRLREDAQEAVGRQNEPETQETPLVLKKFLNEAGKMRLQGMSIDSILKEYGLAPGGRNNQNLKAMLDEREA